MNLVDSFEMPELNKDSIRVRSGRWTTKAVHENWIKENQHLDDYKMLAVCTSV